MYDNIDYILELKYLSINFYESYSIESAANLLF